MKKVFLIVPPNVECDLPPLGLLYIASTIKKECDVKIIDCGILNINLKKLEKIISEERPNLVGVIATSPRIYYALQTLEMVKRVSKKIKTVIGGPHASAVPSTINNEYIDFLIKGEGEITMKELVINLDDPKTYCQIKGLHFKENNKVVINPPRELIKDLDSLPLPARDLVPIERYNGSIMPIKLPEVNMVASRGCPFQCSYCFKGTFGIGSRFRDPIKVVDEIEYVSKKYNAKTINFFDDEFNMNKEFLKVFTDEIIKRKLNHLKFKAQFRANKQFIDFETLKKLKKAGFYLISYGLESGNQKVLDANRRNITLEEMRRAVILTHKAGIRTLGFFMMGILGETLESAEDTIKFAISIPLDYAQVTIAMPYPGTEFYEIAKKNKWLNIDYQNINLAKAKHLNYRKVVWKRPNLPEKELKKRFKKFYLRFFFRPSYILKTFVRMFSSVDDFKLTLKGIRWVFDALNLTTKIDKEKSS
ncbi:hypothetical protein CEE44_02130 [Candidatus Woesearchaeota archaeon B3_Woes]|nr:MAG: hypothetical protein CEE44_02130 [Candidatus Woesearchaeota archaeon B3_Woes]